MVEERGMMKSSRDLESSQQLFSKVCVWVCSYLGFIVLIFKSEYPDFWELRRTVTVH
jgi:hypothetical protein